MLSPKAGPRARPDLEIHLRPSPAKRKDMPQSAILHASLVRSLSTTSTISN
jgi:hypothetical protein